MSGSDYLFTSESVSEGHPDKICDRISDAVVDAYLVQDPEARVAVETLVTKKLIVLAGETRSQGSMSAETLEKIAREAVRDIGYEQDNFHWDKAKGTGVRVYVHEQSADIAQGVDASGNKSEGAGDQGIMFGYACRETKALMPAPIYYAHLILRLLAEARKTGAIKGLGPDSKSQVTLRYKDGKPVGADKIVVSTQHDDDNLDVRALVRPFVEEALPKGWMCAEDDFLVNPTGRFVIGGPDGDAGLTGRKIIVDTYGGAAPHGGGAFSGKDPTKVDRSATYAARYLAKNVVAAGLANQCTIQLSYAIGVSDPLSVYVNQHNSGSVDDRTLEKALRVVMDLSPRGIREHLKLNRPIYARTAAYGHFGREADMEGGFSWEKTDLVDELRAALPSSDR
ncbi:MAG: methionine adenosyltransferase [Parvularculales bacterium]